MDRLRTDNTIKLTQFISSSSTLKFTDTGDSISYYLYAPLFKGEEKGLFIATRTLHIQANGKDTSVEFRPSMARGDIKHSTKCESISGKDVVERGGTSARSYGGILVRIKRKFDGKVKYGQKADQILLTGSAGWLSAENFEDDTLANHDPGKLTALTFSGNVSNLDVDGSPLAVKSSDGFAIIGDLQGEFDSSGQLHFTGTAKALWKNRARVEPHKMGETQLGPRILLLSIFAAALAIVIRMISARLSGNSDVACFTR